MSLTKVSYSMIQGSPVSVLDYGATGNGTTDDTLAIQAAIDSGASKIYLPAGRYRTTQTIKAISTELAPIYIYGEGSQKTVISFEPATYVAGNDTALWFGNSTQNTPTTIYECRNLTLEDFAVYVNTNARVALRLRETYRTACKRIFLGAENYSVLNDIVCLYIDGGIDCLFEQVHCAPKNGYNSSLTLPIIAMQANNSATLNRTAGSGSGAAFTSSAFNSCYFHVANQIGAILSNQVSFNDCIFEAANTGISASQGSFNTEFINCYYEAINNFAITADGTDIRITSNVVVQGGYYQANSKSGYSGIGGFVNAKNVGKIKVTDVQIFGQTCLGRAVTTTGYANSILLDANYYSLNSSTNDFTPVALTNPFQTISGSPELILNYTSHNLIAEDTISLSNFTTPVNNIRVNQPLWRVSEIVNINQVKLLPLYFNFNASATGNSLGGSGVLIKYASGFAGNFVIDTPEATKFLDAKEHWLSFGCSYVGSGSDNQPMYLGSDNATEQYITTSWCYLMYARRTQSKLQPVDVANYTYIYLDFPTGYEQNFFMSGPAEIPIGKYQTSNFLIGRKIPPGTAIRARNWLAGGGSGYDYTQNQTLEMLIFECNERLPIF